MKTTVDIPDEVLAEALRFTGAKTKRGAIVKAVEEFNRRNRVDNVMKMFGAFPDFPEKDEITAADVEDAEQMLKWTWLKNEDSGTD